MKGEEEEGVYWFRYPVSEVTMRGKDLYGGSETGVDKGVNK